MPFETLTTAPRRVAVIGAGISGMGAAHMLAKDHHVVLYEAEGRLGGHARTRLAGPNRDTAVDTGFIVFNYANYPELTALFDHLDVPVCKSNMSFGASFDGGRLEYALTSLNALFAQKRNAVNPAFLRMVRDIFHFNKHGLEAAQDESLTIRDLLAKLNLSDYFRDRYLLPFSGAIWSTPKEQILDFPAYALLRFFDNHALMGATGQHQWYTVAGGSREYVSRLGASMDQRGVEMRLATPVQAVKRTFAGVEIKAKGAWDSFDEVIFASHSDQALALLADPTPHERETLGAIRYQPNHIVLHSDTSIMPKRRSVWASWIYTEDAAKASDQIDLTYWMNSLQPWLRGGDDYMVTLNATRDIDPALIWDEVTLAHPVYDMAALAAQQEVAARNGSDRTWFCGAWMKNGFHEDGLSSAYDVVRALNALERLDMAAE